MVFPSRAPRDSVELAYVSLFCLRKRAPEALEKLVMTP
jgi:hypothetical protein